MSAYVVDPETVNTIVAMFETAKNQEGQYPARFPDMRYLGDNEFLRSAVVDPAELGRTMYAMNINAVEQRYSDHNDLPGTYDENDRLCEYKYRSRLLTPPTPHQAYKSLQCYLYQCTEGNVKDLPLYKSLDLYLSELAKHIVEQMPEYDHAKWS